MEGAPIHACGTASGKGTDDDDVILDGLAMISLLYKLPDRCINLAVGQEKVDDLRARDWAIAKARMARCFAGELQAVTLEDATGRLGAAAGVANLSFGVAALRHGIYRRLPPRAQFVAWAISRDGTRGLALVQGAAPKAARDRRLMIAAHDGPVMRTVERDRAEVLDDNPESDDEGDAPEQDLLTLHPIPSLDVLLGASNDTEVEPAGSPIRVAKGKGAPLPLVTTYTELVAQCLDGIALAARHRTWLPREGRGREEERILAFMDALVVIPRFSSLLGAWWEEAVELPDPWKVWAPSFVLACLEGADMPEALAGLWRRLSEENNEAAAIAGEALVLGAHPDRRAWARKLSADAHPAVRAAAIEALSLMGALEIDELANMLTSKEERAVRWVALRAAARLPDHPRLDALLRTELDRAPDSEIAWQSARALALRGDPAGYFALQNDPAILQRLGPHVLDVLALLGDADDASLARQVITRCGPTSKVLRGLGRYGHPGAAPILLRALGNEDTAEDASAALVWIFGMPFEEQNVTSADAWQAWLREARLDEATRYRFGKPYAPGCVAEVAAEGAYSQADLSWLVDEANVRAGFVERPTLFRWSPAADASLAPLLTAFSRKDSAFSKNTWLSITRYPGRRS